MTAAVTPSKRAILSRLIAEGKATPIKNFVRTYKNIPKSAVKDAYTAVDYGVMAGETLKQLDQRERVERLLEKTQPLSTRLALKFGIGGTRKTKPKTKNLMIPPQLAELGVEVAEALVLGGARRTTRKKPRLNRRRRVNTDGRQSSSP